MRLAGVPQYCDSSIENQPRSFPCSGTSLLNITVPPFLYASKLSVMGSQPLGAVHPAMYHVALLQGVVIRVLKLGLRLAQCMVCSKQLSGVHIRLVTSKGSYSLSVIGPYRVKS